MDRPVGLHIRRRVGAEARSRPAHVRRTRRSAVRAAVLSDIPGFRSRGSASRCIRATPRAPRSTARVGLSFCLPGGRAVALQQILQQSGRDASRWTEASLQRLFRDTHPGPHSWQDRGYLADVHPLKLWTLAHLYVHPTTELQDLLAARAPVRKKVYNWLYRARRRPQDRRIRTVLEQDAFVQIHQMWGRLGYPFLSLIPLSPPRSAVPPTDRPPWPS